MYICVVFGLFKAVFTNHNGTKSNEQNIRIRCDVNIEIKTRYRPCPSVYIIEKAHATSLNVYTRQCVLQFFYSLSRLTVEQKVNVLH